MNTMFFFMDNSEFTRKYLNFFRKIDYFILGGYLASAEQIKKIENDVDEIKENHKIPLNLPIKWNLKDIRRTYDKEGKLDVYDKIMDQSDEIRLLMISILNKRNCKLVMAAKPAYKKEFKKQAYNWAFINILQRLGYVAKDQMQSNIYPSVSIIMDWPEGGDRSFFQSYSDSYYRGQGFHCGNLKALNLDVNLVVSATINSPHLQIADICVGITKDFIRWSYEGKNKERVKKFFTSLIPLFRKSEEGKIMGYGLLVGKTEDYEKIEGRIKEIQEIEVDDIPF